MKRIYLTIMVTIAGMIFASFYSNAQVTERVDRAAKRQKEVEKWHQDMAEFRARSEKNHKLNELTDSIASVQAGAALVNRDFVLKADQVTFKNGMSAFVNSTTNFISVKGNRAVIQISPSNFSSGPNGLGGITVDGIISGMKMMTDNKGRTTLSMNVTGIGINAQVEIYLFSDSSSASATIYPNFNSNTVWVSGTIVPYENSNIFEGNSL